MHIEFFAPYWKFVLFFHSIHFSRDKVTIKECYNDNVNQQNTTYYSIECLDKNRGSNSLLYSNLLYLYKS